MVVREADSYLHNPCPELWVQLLGLCWVQASARAQRMKGSSLPTSAMC